MPVPARQRVTPEQYLALEREADTKSEYFNGEIFAMAGASREHNLITLNVGAALHSQLRGRPCETYPSDMKVKVSATGLYTYPDVTIACGELQFDDDRKEVLVNPTLIVEVLSSTTEAYDRGDKFGHYRKLESLKEYVLIAQDRYHVEHYLRQSEHQWLLTEVTNPEDTVHLPSIGCHLALSDIYERLEFAGAEAAPAEQGVAEGQQ
jgi:Uma2 family endonuclease